MTMKDDSYEKLLTRIEGELSKVEVKKKDRIEIPKAVTFWSGQKTYFRNFSLYPKLLRRTAEHFLAFLSKELATSASLDGDRAIFIGRKTPDSFDFILKRYIRQYVNCSVCNSYDTSLEKVKRLYFINCEACGAKTTAGSR